MDALLIRVSFPSNVYRGGDLARPEALPSPARLHAAFLSAAAGGPTAAVVDGELVADGSAEAAVRWLEDHAPIGVLAPRTCVSDYVARRHRVRLAVNVARGEYHREETPFEPLSAVDGPVVFAWPPAPDDVREELREIASEITHLGRADSTVVVSVSSGTLETDGGGLLVPAEGRGAGAELRLPRAGRTDALLAAHRRARARSPHTAGKKSVQAPDEPVDSAEEGATALVRFAVPHVTAGWPFSEVWRVPVSARWPGWSIRPGRRVATAVAVHRAIVAAIGDDVPAFVSGRAGTGPLAGGGHLAIQLTGAPSELLLGLPTGTTDADRALLLGALASGPRVRIGRAHVTLGLPQIAPAAAFWPVSSDRFATAVPLVLDAPGTPRHAPWSLQDSVICSLAYALRGPLESFGVEWEQGWAFRRQLVARLREHGARASAVRVTSPGASRFMHRSREGDLIVAVHALVELGELGGDGRGFLALGRARHLGGGLLQPLGGMA